MDTWSLERQPSPTRATRARLHATRARGGCRAVRGAAGSTQLRVRQLPSTVFVSPYRYSSCSRVLYVLAATQLVLHRRAAR
jgi:hypothetical protein